MIKAATITILTNSYSWQPQLKSTNFPDLQVFLLHSEILKGQVHLQGLQKIPEDSHLPRGVHINSQGVGFPTKYFF